MQLCQKSHTAQNKPLAKKPKFKNLLVTKQQGLTPDNQQGIVMIYTNHKLNSLALSKEMIDTHTTLKVTGNNGKETVKTRPKKIHDLALELVDHPVLKLRKFRGELYEIKKNGDSVRLKSIVDFVAKIETILNSPIERLGYTTGELFETCLRMAKLHNEKCAVK